MKQVKITVTFYRYVWSGEKTTKRDLLDPETGQPWRGTRKEARELINKLESGRYILAHSEYRQPTYTINYVR